jgi:hypothetical protein
MPEATVMDVVNVFDPGSAAYGYWDALPLVGAALMASIALLTFLYLWATLFRDNNLLNMVKFEFYEMVVSAILVAMVLMVVGMMANMPIGGVLPDEMLPDELDPSMNIYQLTEDYFMKVGLNFSDWLNLNYILNVYVDQVASITPYARPLGIGLVASPLAGLAAPIKQLLYNATTALSIAYIVNFAQYYTFLFATGAFLKYYLPMGLFLRSFTPTRRFGGSIIAVCLGFVLIFPLLILLSYLVFFSNNGPMVTFASFVTNYIYDNTSVANFPDMFENMMNPGKFEDIGFAEFLSGAVGGVGNMLMAVFKTVFVSIMMFPISLVGQAFIMGFVMPAFNVLMFTQATITLSKSFGEEVDIGALTRMI